MLFENPADYDRLEQKAFEHLRLTMLQGIGQNFRRSRLQKKIHRIKHWTMRENFCTYSGFLTETDTYTVRQ